MDLIEKIIELIDEKIKEKSNEFNKKSIYLMNDLSLKTKITNERSLASIASYNLYEYFKKENNYSTYLEELQIELPKLNIKENSEIDNEVAINKNKPSNYVYIDSYFQICDINNKKMHLFIEYKLSNQFEYSKLAYDYLKYKLYTKKNDTNSIFIYVIFDKKENYPTIKSKPPHYIYLDKYIKKENFLNNENRVFIYINKNISNNPNSMLLEKKEIEIYNELNKINIYFDNDSVITKIDSISELKNNIFYLHKDVFKPKVIIAYIIQINYFNILNFYATANSKGIFDVVINKLSLPLTVKNDATTTVENNIIQNLIDDAKNYFKNFEKRYKDEKKKEAIEDGLSANFCSSKSILEIIYIVSRIYEIEFNFARCNKNNRYEDIVKNLGEKKYVRFYKEKPEGITRLAFEIIYIILNLYNEIFYIDEDLKCLNYKENFLLLKQYNNIIESYKKINEILYEKKENINFLKFKEENINLFLEIFKHTN